MLYLTAKRENKTQLHKIFILNIVALLIWELGQLLEVYWRAITGVSEWGFVYFYFLGLCYLPPFIMFLGIIYNKRRIQLKPIYLAAFIPSTVSYILLLTSRFHNLFLITYSVENELMEVGKYFFVHNIITYIYIVIGLVFFIYTSLRSSGFFSRQSIMIFIGMLVPFVVNMLSTYKLVEMPVYMTPVSFSITIIMLMLSVLRYDFLNVLPVATGTVFEQMTDGVLIIDEDLKIIDKNDAADEMFKTVGIKLERNLFLDDILKMPLINEQEKRIFYLGIKKSMDRNKGRAHDEPKYIYKIEKKIEVKDLVRYLSIEVSSVYKNNIFYSSVILIKDITELKNQMEQLRRNQEILREQERLASLGNLIGGIAHNLKTPIMTISGVSKTLEALGEEYRDSIDDPEVSKEDHREIAEEIIEWSHKVAPYCSYMSEMISAVKGQAVQLSTDQNTIFTLYELLSRINILMKFELKKYHCELKQDMQTSIYNELKGDISILVQVFNNIITNAIQAYRGKEGVIDFKIKSMNGKILFVITDYGVGIPDSIKSKLFKEMVTTKGRDGTGLGMYMAYSTIRGHFNGNLTFKSEVGKGTSFFVEIPIYKEVA
jgi:signal transduction histidine kinase